MPHEKIFSATWVQVGTFSFSEYLPPGGAYGTAWPVYRPYRIHEDETGRSLIVGDQRGYWQTWGNRDGGRIERVESIGDCGRIRINVPKVEVKFYNPRERDTLLPDLLAVKLGDQESALTFVNSYGLLGISLDESPLWVAAQMPPRSFAVYEELLEDFFTAVRGLQEAYELFAKVRAACDPAVPREVKKQARSRLREDLLEQDTEYCTYDASTGREERYVEKGLSLHVKNWIKSVLGIPVEGDLPGDITTIAKAILLGNLRSHLAGVRPYPQLNSKGAIIDGWAGLRLIDYAWLQFFDEVKAAPLDGSARSHSYRKCANCGSMFEISSQYRKYCPDCNGMADARRKGKYAEVRRRAVRLAKEGMPVGEVAREVGRSEKQVEKWVSLDAPGLLQ